MYGKGRCWLLLLAWPALAAAQQIEISDPAGDDHGPGGYRYPDHPLLRAGSFDLRRVSLRHEGNGWLLEVEFQRPVEKAEIFVSRDDRRQVFLQTVDVYLRLKDAGPGRSQALPGREVSFCENWHRAVVLSPAPDVLRSVLDAHWLSEDVLVVERVRASGRRLRAKFSAAWLGGEPQSLSLLVTGTSFSGSLRLLDRARGSFASSGLAMEVEAHPFECRLDDPQGARCAFWGCRPCGGHPRVIDLLAPAGVQERWLSSYHAGAGAPAKVCLVPAGGR